MITGDIPNLQLELSQSKADSGSNNGTNTGKKNKCTQPLGSGLRPFNVNNSGCLTPLAREKGLAAVRETLLLVNNAHFLFASDANYHNRSTFLGSGQNMQRRLDHYVLGETATAERDTSTALMASTWHVLTQKTPKS